VRACVPGERATGDVPTCADPGCARRTAWAVGGRGVGLL